MMIHLVGETIDAKRAHQRALAGELVQIVRGIFPGLGGDRMALKLNGKDDRLTRRDFMSLARTIGLPQSEAETAISELTGSLAQAVETVRLPPFAAEAEAAATVQGQVLALAGERCTALASAAG